jgi:hypothetical protein
MLRIDQVDLGELADALADQNAYDVQHLIDPATGQLDLWSDEIGAEEGEDEAPAHLRVIEPISSHEWFQDMADFAAGLSDERYRTRLERALDGRKPFRHFRDAVHDGLPERHLTAWNEFRDARRLRRAVAWLADEGLVPQDDADRFAAAHPDPQVP